MKTIREYIDLIESAQPVDLRARAAELAIQILKNADIDDDSEQGYIRVDPNALFQFHILMNTVKKQGVAEGTDKYAELKQKIRDLSQSGNEHEARKQRHELNRLLMIDRDRQARGVAEDTDKDVEHLANAFADIYYGGAGMGMISATEKVKLARNIVQAVDDGRLSVEQLKQDLKDVGELQQKLGRDGRFDTKEQDIDEDQATARMGLMSAMGSNSDAPDRQRMAQQAIERIADNK